MRATIGTFDGEVVRVLVNKVAELGRQIQAKDYMASLGFPDDLEIDVFDFWHRTSVTIAPDYMTSFTDEQIEGYLEVLSDELGEGERELAGYDETELSYVFRVPENDELKRKPLEIRVRTGKPPENCEVIEEEKWIPGRTEIVKTIKCNDTEEESS